MIRAEEVEEVEFPTDSDGEKWGQLLQEVEVPKVWGKIYFKEDLKFALPDGLTVGKWGKTRIDMKKFAHLQVSYERADVLSRS